MEHQFEPLEIVAVEVSEQQVGELVVPATPAGQGLVTVLGEGDQGRAPIGGMRFPADEFSSFEGVDEPCSSSARGRVTTGCSPPRWTAEGLDELRHPLLAGLTGDVIETALGEGRNLPHYPPQVDRLVAVEPSLSCDEGPELPRTTHPSPWR